MAMMQSPNWWWRPVLQAPENLSRQHTLPALAVRATAITIAIPAAEATADPATLTVQLEVTILAGGLASTVGLVLLEAGREEAAPAATGHTKLPGPGPLITPRLVLSIFLCNLSVYMPLVFFL